MPAAPTETTSIRDRAIAARRAATLDSLQREAFEHAKYRDQYAPALRDFIGGELGIDPDSLPEIQVLTTLRLWRYSDSNGPTLAVLVAPGILISASPDQPAYHFGVSLPCPVCESWMPARRVGNLAHIGKEIEDAPDQCDDCGALRAAHGRKQVTTVMWPPIYDEERHRPEVTQTECLRVIANNLAVVATALDDINQNGLLR